MMVKSAKDFMMFKPTESVSLVSPKKSLKEKILLKEKLLWSQPKDFNLKKVKSEPTISKIPFLSQHSIRKYEKSTRKKSMEDVNNSLNELDTSVRSASQELNDIWSLNRPVRVPVEIDERQHDNIKKKREIIWKKARMYKYDKLF